MNSALQVTEIVGCILQHVRLTRVAGPEQSKYDALTHFGGVKHCLTVNKLWFYESARIIWRTIESSRLGGIDGLERQQIYANFVMRLHARSDMSAGYTIPSQLKFPILRSVRADNREISEESLYPLLVPSLSDLVPFKIDISDQFLLDVIERCPALRTLTICGSPKLTTAGLQKFLVMTRCPSISLLYLSECVGCETMCKAAENKFIEGLLIPSCDKYAFSQVRKLVKHPFPSLTRFSSGSFEGSIEDILCMNKTLKTVSLIVPDFNTAIRFSGSKRPECSIEKLDIRALSGYLDKSVLIELAKYSNLKTVFLWVKKHTCALTQLVDDKWIDEFTRLTPSLDSFKLFGFHIEVTSKALNAIGRNCPDVTDLELWWGRKYDRLSVDKNDLSPDLPCLFPKLKNIGVAYSCFSDGGMNHEEILWHFPLVDFTERKIKH